MRYDHDRKRQLYTPVAYISMRDAKATCALAQAAQEARDSRHGLTVNAARADTLRIPISRRGLSIAASAGQIRGQARFRAGRMGRRRRWLDWLLFSGQWCGCAGIFDGRERKIEGWTTLPGIGIDHFVDGFFFFFFFYFIYTICLIFSKQESISYTQISMSDVSCTMGFK